MVPIIKPGFSPGSRGRWTPAKWDRRSHYLASEHDRVAVVLVGAAEQELTIQQAIEALGRDCEYHEIIIAPSRVECDAIRARNPENPKAEALATGHRLARAHSHGRPYVLTMHEQDGRFHFHLNVQGPMPTHALGKHGEVQQVWDREFFRGEERIVDWAAHQRFQSERARLQELIRRQQEHERRRREAVRAAAPGKKAEVGRSLERTSRDLIEQRYLLELSALGARYESRGTHGSLHHQAEQDRAEFRRTAALRRVERREHHRQMLAVKGRVPEDGYCISREDLQSFLGRANTAVAHCHGPFFEALPDRLMLSELKAKAAMVGDPDLARLINEYLPLTFSRRHGDPSRPWNIFSIRVKESSGYKLLDYQGNWRDIFQNWEALGHSYPGFIESMISKFLDCSTADGYNPYRIMREGFEWETIDPHDAWSFIGYWGDHQVIYLLKLLEASNRFHPGELVKLLGRRVFSYADVPYRIKPYAELIANPRNTIHFDHAAHREAMERAERLGADGKVLMGADGPFRTNLTEKLLLVALTKLTNFIPEAGVWMNTQRPEWNDANNALVGFGVSMVTLCYLRRYMAFCRDLFRTPEAGSCEVSVEMGQLLQVVEAVLQRHEGSLGGSVAAPERKRILDALGRAGSEYRTTIYSRGFSGEITTLGMERLQVFCDLALRHIDHSIQANRRSDGLYHSYNLMKVAGDGIDLRNLHLMLEGQVAVLSSGALSSGQALVLLDALRSSPLYRPDQGSYMLYPDRMLPGFLNKNNGNRSGHPMKFA